MSRNLHKMTDAELEEALTRHLRGVQAVLEERARRTVERETEEYRECRMEPELASPR